MSRNELPHLIQQCMVILPISCLSFYEEVIKFNILNYLIENTEHVYIFFCNLNWCKYLYL